ncbi:MAG: plastocyanin/azurin family copper-binding protein [Pseudomonadota bacterium]
MTLRTGIFGAATALVLLGQPAVAQEAHDVHVVHQVSDHAAAIARHIFRFEPAILMLEPGDTVRFLNSVGSHTVMSQDGLWPGGVEIVDIRGEREANVTFDTPGLYGITCARHGRYGMTMLIAVGDAGLAGAEAFDPTDLKATSLAKEAFSAQAKALVAEAN